MSDETPDTPDTPDTPKPTGDASDANAANGGSGANGGSEPGTGNTPPKRRPKDSEFFELPPDLKKLPPGGLPATV